MKRITMIALILVLIFSTTAFAYLGREISCIKCRDIDVGFYAHAERAFYKHVMAQINASTFRGDIEDFSLGSPFSVDIDNDNYYVIFPVLNNDSIKGLLEVYRIGTEYISQMTDFYCERLLDLLETRGKEYILFTENESLFAYDGSSITLVYGQAFNDAVCGHNENELLHLTNRSGTYVSVISKSDLYTEISSFTYRGPVGTPITRVLNVNSVQQYGYDFCWAAVCASIINYKVSPRPILTALDVASYIYPANPNHAGSWSDIRDAYNHWGLNVTQTNGIIPFDSVIFEIDSNDPIHLKVKDGTAEHSIAIIGYMDCRDVPDNNESILVIIDPNHSGSTTILLNSTGNFTYVAGGKNYSWNKTRRIN